MLFYNRSQFFCWNFGYRCIAQFVI